MSNKVLVVYVKHTGHVLAALSRATDAASTANLTQLADPSFKVRLLAQATTLGTLPADFECVIPKEQLGAQVVDDETSLLKEPRTFKVADPSKEVSKVDKLSAKTGTPIPNGGRIKGDPILRQNQLNIELEYPAEGPPKETGTRVWALIMRDADNMQIVSGEIKKNEASVGIPLLVPVPVTQTRKVLVLAGNSPIYVQELTAT